MTDLANQRRLASKILECGLDRVWLNPDASEETSRPQLPGKISAGSSRKVLLRQNQ